MHYTPSQFPTSFDASHLKGKSVLITGGASGLGAAFARAFAKAGAFVTIADISRNSGLALEEELTKASAKYVFCDVASWKSQVEAFKTAIASSPTKTLDTVIAAAGIGGSDLDTTPKDPTAQEDPPEPSTRCLAINLVGVYYSNQLAVYYMGQKAPADDSKTAVPRTNSKSIILVGSLAGYFGLAKGVEYTVSKYGVRAILRSSRTETEAVGVRLNAIAPTYINTPLIGGEITQQMKDAGVQFADIQTAIDAVMILASHEGIHGRAICIGSNGNFDLGDDAEGLNGGLAMQAYAEEDRRRNGGKTDIGRVVGFGI